MTILLLFVLVLVAVNSSRHAATLRKMLTRSTSPTLGEKLEVTFGLRREAEHDAAVAAAAAQVDMRDPTEDVRFQHDAREGVLVGSGPAAAIGTSAVT